MRKEEEILLKIEKVVLVRHCLNMKKYGMKKNRNIRDLKKEIQY